MPEPLTKGEILSLYQKIKSAITVRLVGEMYGMEPDRHGMVCCPFHSDNHPSMKLNDRKSFWTLCRPYVGRSLPRWEVLAVWAVRTVILLSRSCYERYFRGLSREALNMFAAGELLCFLSVYRIERNGRCAVYP